ncbi:MAG: hypothetical protein ABI183_13935 [Polyangiaceae bacterium]
MIFLTSSERSLLEEVRLSDEDHGGLDLDELGEDETETIAKLLERGLAEALNEFGEAPDGEEDEREAGGGRGTRVRITALGVEALRG